MANEKYRSDGYKKNCIYSLRSLPEWRHWLHIRASEEGVTAADIIDEAVKLWAATKKKPEPPERWTKK